MPQLTPEIIQALVVAFVIQTIIIALFCNALYKAMLAVKEENRTMKAGLVWLLLFPGFAIFWIFRVVFAISSSLYNEFTDRDFDIEKRPAFNYGIAYGVLSALGAAFFFATTEVLVTIGEFFSIAQLVVFIQYWVKVSWFRKVLESDSQSVEETNEN